MHDREARPIMGAPVFNRLATRLSELTASSPASSLRHDWGAAADVSGPEELRAGLTAARTAVTREKPPSSSKTQELC